MTTTPSKLSPIDDGGPAYTPGPWRIDNDRDDFEIDIVGRPQWGATRFGVIGEWDICHLEILDNADETTANARLIAASPQMFEALVKMDAFWTESHPAGPDGPRKLMNGFGSLSDDTIEVWRAVRSALLTARKGGGERV